MVATLGEDRVRTLFSLSPAEIRAPRASRLLKRLLAMSPTEAVGDVAGMEIASGIAPVAPEWREAFPPAR